MKDYSILNTPYKIGNVTIPNRYSVAPMGMDSNNGVYVEDGIYYHTLRAKGGFGLIMTGAVNSDSQIDPYSALGQSPLQTEEWAIGAKKLVDSVHNEGSKIFCQLTVGLGRNYPMLPSASENEVWGNPGMKSPALTVEQIHLKEKQYFECAKIIKECGFDGLEVHAMHWGYLLDQFGMSFFNKRKDEYGGSLENRLRFAKELLEGVKEACGKDFPVGMRLGLQTFIKDNNQATLTGEEEVGRTLEEGIEISKLLESYGYDFLDVDTGTYDSFYYACPPMYMPQGYMIELAAKAKAVVNIPVIAGGRMQDCDLAEEAVRTGKIDGIALARQSLADPEYPNKVFANTPEKIRPCLGCNIGCMNRLLVEQKPCSCAVNPSTRFELVKEIKPATDKKKVVVIGGGVAGMETSRTSALRGHDVTLYEKSDKLGGHLLEAGAHSFKSEVSKLKDWYIRELADLNVKVELNREVCPMCISKMDADVIILATGSVASIPNIKGIEKAIVSLDAINHPEQLGQKVVVVGGGLVGCELAYDEAKKGKEVVVVEALDAILASGVPAPIPNAQMMRDLFEYKNISVLAGHKLIEVTDTGVVLENSEGTIEVAADSVVNAMGFRPGKSLKDALNVEADVYEIGDAKEARSIYAAVNDAYEIASII